MPSRKADLDVRIDEIVLRALEHEPARRYQRALDVKSELQGLDVSAASSKPVGRPNASALSAAAWLAPTPRRALLREISIPYACIWAVGFLALNMDVGTPFQAFLATLFVASATPYLAWRWWTGRGQRRGHALGYGLGAVLSASFATLAARGSPEMLLDGLIPGESFDPSVDPLFLRIVAITIAGAWAVAALRARRKLGVLSWKRFTNFAFDLLIVLSAISAALGALCSSLDGIDPDRGGVLVTMPLFFVGFACDVGERRLQPLERATDSQRRGASPAQIDSAG